MDPMALSVVAYNNEKLHMRPTIYHNPSTHLSTRPQFASSSHKLNHYLTSHALSKQLYNSTAISTILGLSRTEFQALWVPTLLILIPAFTSLIEIIDPAFGRY